MRNNLSILGAGGMPAVWGAAAEQGVGVVGTSMDLCGIPGLEFTTMSISYNPCLPR